MQAAPWRSPPFCSSEQLFAFLHGQWGEHWWPKTLRNWTTRLYKTYWRMQSAPLKCHATTKRELTLLTRHLDLSGVMSVLDPFCGTFAIADALRDAVHADADFFNNDLRDVCKPEYRTTHEDAVLPGYYARFRSAWGAPEAIVTSPPFALNDLVLMHLLDLASKVVVLHALDSYRGARHRKALFARLDEEERIHVIAGMPNTTSRRCSWIVVFPTRELCAEMVVQRRGFC